MALLGNRNRPVGPGDKVLLVGGKGDKVDERMGETPLPGPRGTTPKLNTLGVDGGEVGTEGRPLHKGLGPVLTVDNVLGGILLVVPENTNSLSPEHNELISAAAAGVGHEGAEVLLLLELLDLGRSVLVIDTALAAIAVDIGKLVDAEGVLLVEGDEVELSAGGSSLGGGRVLDEGESTE